MTELRLPIATWASTPVGNAEVRRCAMYISRSNGDVAPTRQWIFGFIGFLGLLGLYAFAAHQPAMLFWFTFFTFFTAFGYLRDELKYVGLLGVAGLVLAILGLARVIVV
jgi:hypothetical protein